MSLAITLENIANRKRCAGITFESDVIKLTSNFAFFRCDAAIALSLVFKSDRNLNLILFTSDILAQLQSLGNEINLIPCTIFTLVENFQQ